MTTAVDSLPVPLPLNVTLAVNSLQMWGCVTYVEPELGKTARQVNFAQGPDGWFVEAEQSQWELTGWGPFLEHARRVMRGVMAEMPFDWPEAPPW